jgi:signal transduction histidine kinase/ActR/RegA family two-component response regulator
VDVAPDAGRPLEGAEVHQQEARRATPRTAGLALLALLATAAATFLTAATDGIVRLGLVVLVVILVEARRRELKAAAVVVSAAAAFAVLGVSLDSAVAVLVRLAMVVAVALVIQRAPARAGAGAGPAHRFAVLAVWLAAVVVLGALLETELRRIVAATPPGSYAKDYFAVAVPLALAVFLAATIVARPRLDRDRRPGLALLAGPLAVVVLVLAASETMLRYWEADDQQTLQTAVETSGAAMQQAVAADVDSFLARAGTPPRLPWTTMQQFALTMQPLIQGNQSVSAVALLDPNGVQTTAEFVLSRQGDSPQLGAVMGAAPEDAAAIQQTLSTGAVQLLGVREVPAADGQPQPHLLFVAPQALADPASPPRLLSMAVSIPVVLQEGSQALGPLAPDVVLQVVDVTVPSDPETLATVASDDASSGPDAEVATATAAFGTVTLEVRAIATDQLGPSLQLRTAVLGGLWLFGLVALLLVLQAANARDRSQRALAEREALLATALEAAPGLVVLVDAAGTVRMSNEGRLDAGSAQGRPVLDVLPFAVQPGDRERLEALLDDCMHGRPGSLEHIDMTSEESLRIHTVTAVPVGEPGRGGPGAVRGLVQVQDVTDQRARAVRGAQAQRLQALGTMAGGLAHDFNNLLFIITGYLQMLEEDERVTSQPDLARYVDRAVDAAGRGTEIASSLLAVSRSQPLQATEVEVGRFVRDMLPLVKQAVGKERTVELVVEPGAHGARVDSGQLSSAVLNLVINSRDATDAGGRIAVVVGRRTVGGGELDLDSGEYVVIEVRDDGTGMTPEVGARAFEPFFSTKSTGNGTGLGLTAVYSFAAQSGGVALISSEPGRGTTVTILLPLVELEQDADDAVAPEQPVVVEEPVHDDRRRVLVVDDEEALAGLVAAWVRETGADVRVAHTPSDGLELAASFQPHVLLSDIRLGDPEMDGIELSARVVMESPDVAVVLMTGYSDRMTAAQAVGTRVLAKPFTKDELHEVLATTSDAVAPAAAEVTR